MRDYDIFRGFMSEFLGLLCSSRPSMKYRYDVAGQHNYDTVGVGEQRTVDMSANSEGGVDTLKSRDE